MLYDFILVQAYIGATRRCSALSACQIISGIDRPTFFTGKMFDHLFIPSFVPYFFDASLRLPQLDSMRHFGLKGLQVFAGVLSAFAAEINSFSGGTFGHCADAITVKTSLFRPASLAGQFFSRTIRTPGHQLKSFRVPMGPDIDRACGAKQPADRGETL